MIPKWWGIELASRGSQDKVELIDLRKSRRNPHIDQLMVAGLLWKVEMVRLLREHDVPTKLCQGSIRQLQKRMLAELPFHVIHARVCQQLRARQGALRGLVMGTARERVRNTQPPLFVPQSEQISLPHPEFA